MKVLKFGGSSVGSPESIKKVIEIVNNQPSDTIIVVSAFQGVTDQILRISEDAFNGKEEYKIEAEAIRNRHLEAIDILIAAALEAAAAPEEPDEEIDGISCDTEE